MRHYFCYHKNRPEWGEHIFAPTRGQAKVDFWRSIADAGGYRYQDIRAKVTDKLEPSQQFLEMLRYRRVEFAKLGMRVSFVDGSEGIIVGSNHSGNLDVYFTKGRSKGQTGNCHPHWEIAYHDHNDQIIKSYQSNHNQWQK